MPDLIETEDQRVRHFAGQGLALVLEKGFNQRSLKTRAQSANNMGIGGEIAQSLEELLPVARPQDKSLRKVSKWRQDSVTVVVRKAA